MTLEKVNKIKGFLFVDKIHILLLYQRFKALFLKNTSQTPRKNFCG